MLKMPAASKIGEETWDPMGSPKKSFFVALMPARSFSNCFFSYHFQIKEATSLELAKIKHHWMKPWEKEWNTRLVSPTDSWLVVHIFTNFLKMRS